MLVLRTADAWQLVEQVDHATLSGQLAAAWGRGPFAPADPALVLAAYRHDDGWSVWDRHPLLDDGGEPMSFLRAPVTSLLSSYVACVDAVAYESAHEGLLVSRHVSGLRRRRYGLDPQSASRRKRPQDPHEDPAVTRFVESEERRQRALLAESGIAERQIDHEYAQLQLFDVLSLKLCLTDLHGPDVVHELDLAPTECGKAETALSLRTGGDGRVTVAPWPFSGDALALTVPRRVLPPASFASVEELRETWDSATVEPMRIELIG